jgi:flagellar FliL protein
MAKAKKEEAEEPKEAAEGEALAEGGEAPAEGEAAAAEGGGGKKKLIIIIAGAVLLLGGGGAAAYFTGMLDGLLGKKAAEGEAGAEAGKEGAKGEHGAAKGEKGKEGEGVSAENFVAIPTMIVNLNSDDGAPRYLRLTVQLELENATDKPAVEAIIPKVVDQFQTYLRELRVRDLRGSGGIYRLQMELLWRVNQAAAPIEVKDVLFQEILIQ